MSIIQVKGTGKSLQSERSLFIGPTVPAEIKRMLKPLKKISQPVLRSLLQEADTSIRSIIDICVNLAVRKTPNKDFAVKDLEGKEIQGNVLDELMTDGIAEETLAYVYAGLLKLLKLALRIPQSSLKQEVFVEDLEVIGISKELIPDIASVVYGSRRAFIDSYTAENKPRLPHLDSFRWRVDVAISTSSLSRALQPMILVEMTLSDGKLHQFEMDIAKFHELRYNVSSVLKDIEDIEKRSILKIQDKA